MKRTLILIAITLSTAFASPSLAEETEEEDADDFIVRVPAPCVERGYDAPKGATLVGFPLPEARVKKILADEALTWTEDLKFGDVIVTLLRKMKKEHRDEVLRRYLTQEKPTFRDFPRDSGLTESLLIELDFEMCGVALRAE